MTEYLGFLHPDEVAVSKIFFQNILERIDDLRRKPLPV